MPQDRPLGGDLSIGGGSGDALLQSISRDLAGCPEVDAEFSVRLRPGRLEEGGRFGVWLPAGAATDAAVGRLLDRFGAPGEVRAALGKGGRPVRKGIALALDKGGTTAKFYRHTRAADTGADLYHAWRWTLGRRNSDDDTRHATYDFHFLPETPGGLRPLDLVPAPLQPAYTALLGEVRLRQLSGFWLRRAAGGGIDQMDLAFPWMPLAGSLPGFAALTAAFALPEADAERLARLPVRHIAVAVGAVAVGAVAVGAPAPAVTVYCAAPLDGPWPTTEAALRQAVAARAAAEHRAMEEVWRRLPPLPAPEAERTDLDHFYDGPASLWRPILGEDLHYHAGLFEDADGPEPDDAAMDRALRRAVTELYPFLPAGGSVYDVGCGWGGPMAMWTRDLGCSGLGITISRGQFRHVAARGLPVRWGDAVRTVPPGWFDCAVLLESLCHVADKARLLALLRETSGRLVARVNCQDAAPPGTAFGDTMHMIDSATLRRTVEAAGWRIRHWRDRRREAVPSVASWARRLRAVPAGGHRHVETLRAWCGHVAEDPWGWGDANPLIELVAD